MMAFLIFVQTQNNSIYFLTCSIHAFLGNPLGFHPSTTSFIAFKTITPDFDLAHSLYSLAVESSLSLQGFKHHRLTSFSILTQDLFVPH